MKQSLVTPSDPTETGFAASRCAVYVSTPHSQSFACPNIYGDAQSRECQKDTWKTRHKRKCQSHILKKEVTMNDGAVQNPRREKLLASWLNVWRGMFELFFARALDLANHKGEERNKTHW